MLRRGIFVKIYLCFWLTIILVLMTQIWLDRLDQSSPFYNIRRHMVASLALFGQAELAYREAGRPGDVAELARRFKQTDGMEVYLLDHAGNSLAGFAVPEPIRGLAARARHSGASEQLRREGRDFLAVPITALDGTPYLAVATVDVRKFMPRPFGSPNMVLRVSIVMLISGVVCYLLTRYLVAPLLTLRDATRRFAGGELSVRIGDRVGRRRDETTELARDFDVMAERIDSLLKLQRQLIGDISHELRSPLARLNVALDLARQRTSPEADFALNRIEEEARELNEMIGELLTLTRLESGSARIEMTPVDLAELVRDIARDGNFEAQGSNRGVTLLRCEECVMNGNAELLRRAIGNVVRNAIHYTRDNSEVEISLERRGGAVAITARDRGPGVPEHELVDIFHPFYRASASRERQTGGTGLGLSISERAIHLHGGTITAENASGGGLIVNIALPITAT